MTSSRHGPYAWGFTHATMGATEGRKTARWSQSQKSALSSDCRLQLACMKSESLVTAGQLNGAESAAPEVTGPTRKRGRCRRCGR